MRRANYTKKKSKVVLSEDKRQKVAELWPKVKNKKAFCEKYGINPNLPKDILYIKYKYENAKIDDLISCLTLHVKLCVDGYGYRFLKPEKN